MRRITRDKHWLLLSIVFTLLLAMAPLSRAQSQSQYEDQDQPQDPAQQGAEQFSPSGDSHDSHARIVRISSIEGQVRIDRGQGYESATMNVPVAERNWLQTRSDGWVEVQFEDGSLVRLAPDTVISFSELSRLSSGGTVTTIDLDQGEAEFKITKHDDSEFQVTVKNKTIVLEHSGSFRVTSTNSDPMEVVVWKGEVGVRDPDSGDTVAVRRNETFVLSATDPAEYALDKGAEADGLDQWSKQRDDYLSTYVARGGYLQSPYQYGASDLNYYGEYFDAPGYGTLWQPNDVGLTWDPFANGYWAYFPGFGYTWVSAYPWGWMPYRYGRWVYINHRGWCWAPGGWNTGWHTGPRWVNAPPGFRAPVPPAQGRIVISGAPGGRVVIRGTSNDRGGSGRSSGPETAGRPGRLTGGDDRDHQGTGRGNQRIFTNDDVARVPRTDVPSAQPAQPTGVVDADRKPKVVEPQPVSGGSTRQNDEERSRGNREQRSPVVDRTADRANVSNPPPVAQPVPAQVSQPSRQYTPPPAPVHQYTPPPAPVHQSPPASAPARSYSPPASSSSRSSEEGSHGRPR